MATKRIDKPLPDRVARLILALGKLREQMPDTWRRLAVELAIYAIYSEYKGSRDFNENQNQHPRIQVDVQAPEVNC